MRKIDSGNIGSYTAYLIAANELNRYVKDAFSKEQQKELSISDILPGLHDEILLLEKEVNRYIKANAGDYIARDHYYKGRLYNSHANDECFFHFINYDGSNMLNMDRVTFNHQDNDTYIRVDASEHISCGKPVYSKITRNSMVFSIIDGSVKEITKEEFDAAVERYRRIRDAVTG